MLRRVLLGMALLVAVIGVLQGPTALSQSANSLDLVLLIDSSASTATTDPDNLRIHAAEFMLDYVQAVGEAQGVTHRFAAANFNTETLDEVEWTLLQGDAAQGKLVPRSEGGTDFEPALDYAAQMRADSGTANPMAVIIFTDGSPDPVGNLEAYFQELESTVTTLEKSGAQIFVIAVGDEPEVQIQWISLVTSANYRSVDATTDLNGVYHDFLAELLGLGTEAVRTVPAGESTTVTVEPYLEQVVFLVIKQEPQAKVTVLDPAGAAVGPARGGGQDDLHTVYAVNAPAAGLWSVQIEEGSAQVWIDRRYSTLRLNVSGAPQAVGASLPLEGELKWRSVVVDDPDLVLQVEVSTADSTQPITTTTLIRQSGGSYRSQLAGLETSGTYTLTLTARWAGQAVGARPVTATVSLYPVPTIVSYDVPQEALVSQPVTVTTSIANAERLGSESQVFIRLLRADGSTAETPALHDDGRSPDAEAGDDIFAARVLLPAAEGRYRLEFVIQGVSRDGVVLEAQPPSTWVEARSELPQPTATATATPTPSPTSPPGFDVPDIGRRYPWLLIGLAAGIGGASALAYLVWRYTFSKQSATEESDFIKRAEERLQQGKRHLAAGQYEEARKAFAIYFELLEQGLESAEHAILETLEPATVGLFESLEHLPEDERDETLLEQMRLRLSPKLDKIRFEAMAHALPKLWQPDMAIGKLYTILSQGGKSQALESIATAGDLPLGPIAQTLKQAIDDPNVEALHRVSIKAKTLPGNSGVGLAEIYVLLETLVAYSRPQDIQGLETQKAIAALKQSGPEVLIDLVEAMAQEIVAIPERDPNELDLNYWQRVSDCLEKRFSSIESRVGQIPEIHILRRLTDRWKSYAKSRSRQSMQPPEIEFDLRPALTYTWHEEELKGDFWLIDVPVNLCNCGQLEALEVEVTMRLNYGRAEFLPSRDQKVREVDQQSSSSEADMETELASAKLFVQQLAALSGGQTEHLSFRLEVPDGVAGRLQIDVAFAREVLDETTRERNLEVKPCTTQYLEVVPIETRDSTPPRTNPYTTGPLLNDSDWQKMGKAGAPEIVQAIVATLHSQGSAGRFIEVVGLRRTGKTTILQRVLREAERLETDTDKQKFICVDLDLNRWLSTEIEPHLPDADVFGAIWYEVLSRLYDECERHLPGSLRDQVSQILEEGERSDPDTSPCLPKIPAKAFRRILRRIQRETQQSLLLALDEGDALADIQPSLEYQGSVNDLPTSSPLGRIMSELQCLVETYGVTVLLAHGHGEAIWEQDAANSPRAHTTKRSDVYTTHLLEKNETLEIAALGGFQFTDLGKKTLWTLTGGYPLLIQALCDYLYKLRVAGKLPGIVSNGIIKHSILDLMTTTDGSRTLDFMRYEFKREEEMVLKILAVWCTDSTTGFLQGVGYGESGYSGLENVLERLQKRWPETGEKIDLARLAQLMDRLKQKELLDLQNLRLRWRVGWLCLLMREVSVEEGHTAAHNTPLETGT